MKARLIAIHHRLSRLDDAKRKRMVNYLPKEEGAFIERLPKFAHINHLGFSSQEEIAQKIDPSWFKTQLNEASNPVTKRFLYDLLLKEFELPLPPQFMSKGPLDFLLELSGDQLITLCRFLGLYDVSLEMKKIIHSRQLKKLEGAFSKEEIGFLNELQRDRRPVAFIEIGLWNWEGDIEGLQEIVLSRGLNRMAKALSEAGTTFMWYLSHRFPMNVGTKLLRFHKVLEDKQIVDILINQVESTYVHIKTHQW